jgi:hypothetical protein
MIPDDLEDRLREGLHREAARVNPRERRTEIFAMIHDESRVAEHGRRWFIPAAAAMSVALIGAIIWGVSGGGANRQNTPAAIPAAVSSSSASQPASSASPSPAAGADPALAGATTGTVALPAYFVGASSPTGNRYGLFREFVRTTTPASATAAQKARAAVASAMNAQPLTNYEPYVQPWSGTTVKNVTVTPTLVTITLSGAGASGFTAEQTRLAVQELVWTAQAAVGQGTIPVKFMVTDGSSTLFGVYPTSQTYNRPAKDLQYQDLAPIWITAPDRGHVYKAGTSVVVTGESCAFEATTQWQLKKGGTAVRSGTTTASSGCPTRGTWTVDLGALASGDYTFRMFEVSMQDGKGIVAETSKPFTVR